MLPEGVDNSQRSAALARPAAADTPPLPLAGSNCRSRRSCASGPTTCRASRPPSSPTRKPRQMCPAPFAPGEETGQGVSTAQSVGYGASSMWASNLNKNSHYPESPRMMNSCLNNVRFASQRIQPQARMEKMCRATALPQEAGLASGHHAVDYVRAVSRFGTAGCRDHPPALPAL